jgi:hypothetical protein
VAESILDSVKRSCDVAVEDTSFDGLLVLHTNAILAVLNDLGIGPVDGFSIEDNTATWDSFIGTDKRLNNIQTYVGLRVRQLFDPPTLSFVIEAMERQIEELGWRISVRREGVSWVDPTPVPTPEPDPWM